MSEPESKSTSDRNCLIFDIMFEMIIHLGLNGNNSHSSECRVCLPQQRLASLSQTARRCSWSTASWLLLCFHRWGTCICEKSLELTHWHAKICPEQALVQFHVIYEKVTLYPPFCPWEAWRGQDTHLWRTSPCFLTLPCHFCKFVFLLFLSQINIAAGVTSFDPNIWILCYFLHL